MLKKNFKGKKLLFGFLAIFVVSIGVLLIYLSLFSTLFWETFRSDRVPLSFKHPKNWPVSVASNQQIEQFENLAESIDFAEEYVPNARGDTLGFITVEEIGQIENPQEFIKQDYSQFEEEPTITEVKVGKENAFFVVVKTKPELGTVFFHTQGRYLIFKNGLIYTIAVLSTPLFEENEEENSKTFQKIITTFKFSE